MDFARKDVEVRTGKIKQPGKLANAAVFAGALLGSTIMGCATTQTQKQITPPPLAASAKVEDVCMKGLPPIIMPSWEGYELLYSDRNREECTGIGSTQIIAPVAFIIIGENTENNAKFAFELHLTASQLRKDNIEATAKYLGVKLTGMIKEQAHNRGVALEVTALYDATRKVLPALREVADRVASTDLHMARYLF